MFGMGIGGPELVVIAFLALLIFGPAQLPKLGKAVGDTVSSMRGLGKDIEREADDA